MAAWKELREAYKAEDPTKKQKARRVWYEKQCKNGFETGLGGDRLWGWDIAKVNRALSHLPEMVWDHDRKELLGGEFEAWAHAII